VHYKSNRINQQITYLKRTSKLDFLLNGIFWFIFQKVSIISNVLTHTQREGGREGGKEREREYAIDIE
jgi:hypothetical protein